MGKCLFNTDTFNLWAQDRKETRCCSNVYSIRTDRYYVQHISHKLFRAGNANHFTSTLGVRILKINISHSWSFFFLQIFNLFNPFLFYSILSFVVKINVFRSFLGSFNYYSLPFLFLDTTFGEDFNDYENFSDFRVKIT